MVRREPPDDCPSPLGPFREVLPAGSTFWRIHSQSFGPTAFNPTPASAKRAPGRFDSIDGDYPYLYAAETRLAVFAEVFLRGETVTSSTVRSVPRKRLEGLRLSRIESTLDLAIVGLVGAEALGRVGQDAWLTACDEIDYPITEAYARSIRAWAPWAAGLRWLAKRDNAHSAYVFFDDRIPAAAFAGEITAALDGDGEELAITMLARLSVTLEDRVD